MSVPYKINAQKEQASEELLVGNKGQLRASEKIPLIARGHVSDRAKKTLDIVGGDERLSTYSAYTDKAYNRSNVSSKKNAFPPIPSSASRSARVSSTASALTHLSSRT